jgi:uncharacterized membrane protein
MSSAIAPLNWPHARNAPPAWRFGHSVDVDVNGVMTRAVQWVMKRNCSFTPKQLLSVYLAVSAIALVIGTVFWWHGAVAVLPFAGVECLVLGIAFLAYARHAADHETLVLVGQELHIEHHWGRRVERCSFRTQWLRVEPAMGGQLLVELSGEGHYMKIGRYVRPELRTALARELRAALKRAHVTESIEDLELGTPR